MCRLEINCNLCIIIIYNYSFRLALKAENQQMGVTIIDDNDGDDGDVHLVFILFLARF